MDEAQATGRPYLEMVIHSSELMPCGSPNGADAMQIEQLYRDLHAMFSRVEKAFVGMTLSEYRRAWTAAHVEAPSSPASQDLATPPWRPGLSHIKGELE